MIYLDFETKSYAVLDKTKSVGVWCYSEHWSTDVICLSYAIDDGPIKSWWPGLPDPGDLFDAIEAGHHLEALNYSFEYSIWHNVMVKRYGWPAVDIKRWQDVGAVAAYLALPTSLEGLARALEMGGKDPEGGRLISKYSKLNLKTSKNIIPPEDFAKFVKYCEQDVRLERDLSYWLGPLPEREQEIFDMNKEINLRGIPLDKDSIEKAIKVVEEASAELVAEFKDITGYNYRQHKEVKQWLEDRGLIFKNLQKKTIQKTMTKIGKFLPPVLKHAIDVRGEVYKASVDKLYAMLRNRGIDGRARFQCKYHGATTGRETGTGFQPLNLSRGEEAPEGVDPNDFAEQLVSDITNGRPKSLIDKYGSAVGIIGKASRHWIRAGADRRFIAGDFSSIEAVVLACLAGEEWKIQAFREGKDLYCVAADRIFKLPPGTVNKNTHKAERQVGKICELAFGYQGAVGAWRGFDNSDLHTDADVRRYNKEWRELHPATVAFWGMLDEAAISAMRAGRGKHWAGPVAFEVQDAWLTMILPNGKRLWYFDAALRMMMPSWHVTNPEFDDFRLECFEKRCECEPRLTVTYRTMKNGRFIRAPSYGGKWSENATQAVSREILMDAMLRARKAGYPLILSVYDEIVAEPKLGFGSVEEFEAIMKDYRGHFYEDWPIGVEAWEGKRYRK